MGRGEAQQRDGGPRSPEDHPRHEGGHAGGVVIDSSDLQMVLINQVHRKLMCIYPKYALFTYLA